MKAFIGDLGNYMGDGSVSIGYTFDENDLIGFKIEGKINLLNVPEFAGVADMAETAYFSATIFDKGFH